MRRVVLASGNSGKLREMRALLAGLALEIVSQAELGVAAAEETAFTFVENAILKARHAARLSGLPAIADDSGLEVDALDGAPGIYSARYAGVGASDAQNLQKLLDALRDVPEERRSARFHCAVAYLRRADDPMPLVCQGVWEGRVLREARGANGFGYDPVFFVPSHGCASAELDSETKNRLSHRAQALRKLAAALGTADSTTPDARGIFQS